MKVAALMKIIDQGWVRTPKGFRIVFQRNSDAGLVQDQVPDAAEAPLASDVTAWRAAWKLAKATPLDNGGLQEGTCVNIRVVDDQGEPVAYYATNRLEIFNPYEGGTK